jgi:DNA sulfur modification protein DndE
MLPNRIHISKQTSEHLKLLKGRIGVTPNLLCRIALLLSLRSRQKMRPSIPRLDGLEFNLSTLFGSYVSLYESLLRQVYGQLTEKEAESLVATHIDDGIKRLRSIRSVANLVDITQGIP